MKMPEALATICELVIGALKREPDREFTTSELSQTTLIEAAFLAQIGPYCSPYARRSAERPGFGKQSGRMVRPFVWSYPRKEAANDCT